MADAWIQFVREINSSNSLLDKKAVIAKHHGLSPILRILFTETTGVTEKSIKKFESKKRTQRDQWNLLKTMEALASRALSGHAALEEVSAWLRAYPNGTDELIRLFSGKPRLGVNLKVVNDAMVSAGYPPVQEEFKVVLAKSFDASHMDPSRKKFITRKLDGLRGLLINDGKSLSFRSRNGHEILSLRQFCDRIDAPKNQWVLDGELCIIDGDGNEDFTSAVSLFRRHEPIGVDFRFKVFDCVALDEFRSGRSPTTWSQRIVNAQHVIDALECPQIEVLEYELYSRDTMVRWQLRRKVGNWEGLMIRFDGPYEAKRTWDLMKIKAFHSAEYRVVDTELGSMDILDRDRGIMEQRVVLAAVTIEHKGCAVRVGSGFNQEQRLEFAADPSKILGKIIEVNYFEEIVDGDHYSLRFPTLKTIWGDKRDM